MLEIKIIKFKSAHKWQQYEWIPKVLKTNGKEVIKTSRVTKTTQKSDSWQKNLYHSWWFKFEIISNLIY